MKRACPCYAASPRMLSLVVNFRPMTFALSLPVLLLLLRATAIFQNPGNDPQPVVREATLAVRGDSVAAVRARWAGRLQRDSTDRAAALGLATLARLTYDFDDADRRYRRLFVAEPARADAYDAYARLGLGLGMEYQGMRGAASRTWFEQALERARAIGDRVAMAMAHFRVGNSLASGGKMAEALAHLDSAARLPATQGDDVRAAARCRRAQILVATTRPGAADSLREANTFAARTGDGEAQGICLRAVALDYWMRDKQDSAATTDQALIDLRKRMRDRSGLALAYALHADHLHTWGDFGSAVRASRAALAEAQASRNHYVEATATLELGGIAQTVNDYAAASEYVERAVRAFEAASDSGGLMIALSYRPDISLAAGDLPTARRQLLGLLDYWKGYGDWMQLVELYRTLAAIETRAGDLPAAARALDEADANARRAQTPAAFATVAYARGQLGLARGDLPEAERQFTRYLASMDTTEHLMRYDARVHLARVYARRGVAERAERELTSAGAALDAWRATLTDPEVRTLAFQAGAYEVNDINASIADVLAALVRSGRAGAAFDLAEARRARELAGQLARTRALAEQVASRADSAARDTASSRGKSLTLNEFSSAMPDDVTALLEYVTGTGGAPTTLFVVTRATATAPLRAYVLATADSLLPDVSRLVGLLEGGDNPAALERSLGAALLDSALSTLAPSITRLVIVPDGPLHRVPWDALRLANGKYAAERFAITLAPSASVAATLWRARRAPGQRAALLAFGNPAIDSMPRLPESANEARLVARYADNGEVRLGDDATADYLERASLASYDVLHFATHAVVDDRVATRTALALAPGRDDVDGLVGPAQLAALRLNGALVVISACRSVGGVVVDGEGVQGLTAPLLAAGAHAVVATSWRISDRGTVPFVEAFYAGMARGLAVGDALRAAKLEAIQRGAPPRDWAAFTAVGDPLLIVPLHDPAPTSRWMLLLIALLAAAGVAAVGMIRSRRRVEQV